MDTPNVVYRIPCNNCNKIYIGQTKQNLKKRMNNHKNDCRKHNLLTNHNKTALTTHCYNENHTFNFDNPDILDVECNFKKRQLSEMLQIQSDDRSINFKTDISNLSNIYKGLIYKHNKYKTQ